MSEEIKDADLNQSPAAGLFEEIQAQDWPGWKKEAYESYLKQRISSNHAKSLLENKKDPFKNWPKSSIFKNLLETQFSQAKAKLTMSSIVIIIAATMLYLFVSAVVRSIYVINFSVDAIVGVVSAILLYINLKSKYALLKQYGLMNYGILMDAASALLSAFLKFLLPPNLDFTLLVFFLGYLAQKRRLEQTIAGIKKEMN